MNEKTLESKRVFDGRLIKVEVLQVELESGLKSRREVVRHPGAVGVLGRLPNGRFVLVRQFRKAIEKDLLEIVAGTRDPNEPAEACAAREMREETGYAAKSLRLLGYLHMAPGFCDERIDIYFAELNDAPGSQDSDEDESVEAVVLGGEEIDALIARGEIHDGKTVAAWMMFEKIIKDKA